MAEVARKDDRPDVIVLPGQLADSFGRAVGGTVVHEDKLPGFAVGIHHFADAPVQLRQGLGFVINRSNDRISNLHLWFFFRGLVRGETDLIRVGAAGQGSVEAASSPSSNGERPSSLRRIYFPTTTKVARSGTTIRTPNTPCNTTAATMAMKTMPSCSSTLWPRMRGCSQTVLKVFNNR